ncbi:hypothetical protein CC80DRAFT_482665 [Byssothecium circinans]|uniref:DUF6594 domain-containing protein n=1 Tax=Byssothecium circinans TaxID=147558 RepID=A0A6A5TE10_9PLEO|nr:hypothetical protein CC80DRAFT_482665 [Byssothecium circinans]
MSAYKQPRSYSRELVVLRSRKDTDAFSHWLGARAIKYIQAVGGLGWKKKDIRVGSVAVHDESVFKLTFWVTSAVASLMPVLSILILVKLKSLNARLGTIAAFNALISVCLTWFTDARRTDMFAVTAA